MDVKKASPVVFTQKCSMEKGPALGCSICHMVLYMKMNSTSRNGHLARDMSIDPSEASPTYQKEDTIARQSCNAIVSNLFRVSELQEIDMVGTWVVCELEVNEEINSFVPPWIPIFCLENSDTTLLCHSTQNTYEVDYMNIKYVMESWRRSTKTCLEAVESLYFQHPGINSP